MIISIRETVVHAEDYDKMVDWYHNVLDLKIVKKFEDGFHYCNLEDESGGRIGISSAKEMGIEPVDRKHNTVVIQFEVDDAKAFLTHLSDNGGVVTFGPNYSEKDDFWYGGAEDIEGNPLWVVDNRCP